MNKHFTYRNNVTVYGTIIDESNTHYIIETIEDVYSWEKELVVITFVPSAFVPATKKWLIEEIRELCKLLGYDKTDSYFSHYFFGGIKETTLQGFSKDTLETCWKKLKNRYRGIA